jgi:hypothetical protein
MASVALIASVARPVDRNDSPAGLFRALLDDYLEGRKGYGSYVIAFATWARSAALRFEDRNGVLVALNAEGRAVAAAETRDFAGKRERTRRVVRRIDPR